LSRVNSAKRYQRTKYAEYWKLWGFKSADRLLLCSGSLYLPGERRKIFSSKTIWSKRLDE
jgi:hypothetical protein